MDNASSSSLEQTLAKTTRERKHFGCWHNGFWFKGFWKDGKWQTEVIEDNKLSY
jgi:hypothetical protein